MFPRGSILLLETKRTMLWKQKLCDYVRNYNKGATIAPTFWFLDQSVLAMEKYGIVYWLQAQRI